MVPWAISAHKNAQTSVHWHYASTTNVRIQCILPVVDTAAAESLNRIQQIRNSCNFPTFQPCIHSPPPPELIYSIPNSHFSLQGFVFLFSVAYMILQVLFSAPTFSSRPIQAKHPGMIAELLEDRNSSYCKCLSFLDLPVLSH